MTAESNTTATDRNEATQPSALIIPESDHPIREHQLDREALKVLYRLRDAGFKGYLVGGGVRDLFLGRTPKDFDISTDARPGQLRQLFRNSRTIGRRFRLVQVFFRGNKIIEVSTLRSSSEFDLDGKEQILPSNNTFGTLEEDAFRRDLTINSLFYEIENHTVIDYTGGVEDLNNRIIRMVGDPDRRFTRDPVRMMRVVRHAARTGFVIEPATRAALDRHDDKLRLCPPSRIRDEILKDLQSGLSRPWAELCMTTPLWATLFPMYGETLLSAQENPAEQLLQILSILDRLYSIRDESRTLAISESFLFAALMLPWACKRYNIPETNVRGQGFHRLSTRIREDIEECWGEPFNIQRMAKDSIATLLINLSTFHHARKHGADPKWLKKKSYYAECSRFYGLYLASVEQGDIRESDYFLEATGRPEVEVVSLPAEQEEMPESRGRGRSGGINPAFTSKKSGVFGLRRHRH